MAPSLTPCVCLCGARDEVLDPPALARCWNCGQPDGMRSRPWRPTPEEAALPRRV